MQDTKLSQVVRSYVGAYEAGNRALAESLLADSFTFTSPNDAGIDRATYFELCWAEDDAGRDQRIESLVVDGQQAYVTYSCTGHDGHSFRNTEVLTFHGEQIASVNVYFGAAWPSAAAA
ncbi:nuclear transport factor 2 family protein [uncultured Ramlibacter sp.]|uniref:nuclear transport factor 2 family protein n=1 Tax=uncultured Ramlibacter sp. TaxID=260755 RepID=UPI00263A35E5|nr:nuclear transport factor 2 family protein [uncultured Ramlibacter sp.]